MTKQSPSSVPVLVVMNLLLKYVKLSNLGHMCCNAGYRAKGRVILTPHGGTAPKFRLRFAWWLVLYYITRAPPRPAGNVSYLPSLLSPTVPCSPGLESHQRSLILVFLFSLFMHRDHVYYRIVSSVLHPLSIPTP